MIDWVKLLDANDIDYWPKNGRRSKRTRDGWLQLPCPKCMSSGDLMGIHVESGKPVCYFCGGMSHGEIIKDLFDLKSWPPVYELIDKYKMSATYQVEVKKKAEIKKVVYKKRLELPKNTAIKKSGANYLMKRGFDVFRLIKDFGAVQGHPSGSQANRILFPIYKDGVLVSYIGRSILKEVTNKYKVCPAEDELVPHKQILDGVEEAKYDRVLVVEGKLDRCAWPLGVAVATLGAKFSTEQMRQLLMFDVVYVMFDDEVQAQKLGEELASGLSMHGVTAYNLCLADGKDSAELSEDEKLELLEELGFTDENLIDKNIK